MLKKLLIYVFLFTLTIGLCYQSMESSEAGETAFIIATDFQSGTLASIDTKTKNVSKELLLINPDSVVKSYGKYLYVVQRFGGDSIIVVDPKNPGNVVKEYSTGNGSNPQDIEFKSSKKAYISLLGENNLLVVNPKTGKIKKKIDLSEFADEDGLVEMGEMVIVKNYLYVSLQRLTNFSADNTSFVVVIDTKKDKIVDLDKSTPGNQAIEL